MWGTDSCESLTSTYVQYIKLVSIQGLTLELLTTPHCRENDMYSIRTAEVFTYHPGLVMVKLWHIDAQEWDRKRGTEIKWHGVYDGISLWLVVSVGPLCLPGRLVLTELSPNSRISGRLFLSLSWSMMLFWLSLSTKINESFTPKSNT